MISPLFSIGREFSLDLTTFQNSFGSQGFSLDTHTLHSLTWLQPYFEAA